MAPKVKFSEGDLVWAADKHYYGVYESKILKIQAIADKTKYFIHYQKWAAKYDSWVDEEYLAAHDDDAGLERLKNMLASLSSGSGAASALTNGTGKGRKQKSTGKDAHNIGQRSSAEVGESTEGTAEVSAPVEVTVTKKRVGTSERDQLEAKKWRKALAWQDLADDIEPEGALKIPFPLSLKQHMVDEWGLITGDAKRLIALPRAITVAMIIHEFLGQRKQKLTSEQYTSYEDFFHGFQYYFNKALPVILLYRQEREQYDTLCEVLGDKKVIPSDIYGGEHILRLIVKMNLNLSNLAIPRSDMNEILAKLTDFVKFIQKNAERFTIIADYPLADEALMALKSATPEQLLVRALTSSSSSSSSSSTSARKGVVVSVEEPTIISPTTGRPVRPTAGKNKYLDDK